ncbi:MAG: alkaline phosphatase [Chitinivibrionales bacterium]|nr:alkaline phosphatase [Chitinivibrionales bacterium]
MSQATSFMCSLSLVVMLFSTGDICAKPTNIILLIPDGCGIAHLTISRWFKGKPLAQDAMIPGICRTYSANSMVTASAAAATALATGYKTWEQDGALKLIGLLPDSVNFPSPKRLPESMRWRPVASVIDAAQYRGMATGLVATARISHATPAGFSCHWHDRDNDNVIMEQQVYHGINVVFGGGMRHLLPTSVPGGKRKDNENLVDLLIGSGYKVITTKTELNALTPKVDKVWGMFQMSHMHPDINRKYFGQQEPSLAEMTKKAIELLSGNQNGFLLMVEGSQVDWCSHNNDAAGVVTEFMAFDAAVQIALDYAQKHDNTMVLVMPDHDNGGMSLGRRGDTYTDIQTDEVIDALKRVKITGVGFLDSLISLNKQTAIDFPSAARMAEQLLAVNTLTHDDSADIVSIIQSVKKGATDDPDVAAVGRLIDRRANLSWTTYGHCGHDVWVYGYNTEFKQTLENTDIADRCFQKMGVNKETLNRELFQDVYELFNTGEKVTITIDTIGAGDGNGGVTVSVPGKRALFPFYKNEMHLNNKVHTMKGLTVYSALSGKVYLPRHAAMLFKKAI